MHVRGCQKWHFKSSTVKPPTWSYEPQGSVPSSGCLCTLVTWGNGRKCPVAKKTYLKSNLTHELCVKSPTTLPGSPHYRDFPILVSKCVKKIVTPYVVDSKSHTMHFKRVKSDTKWIFCIPSCIVPKENKEKEELSFILFIYTILYMLFVYHCILFIFIF